MRRATLHRDAEYDGVFFVCVTTTRIFCRPSCRAKKPLPGNMTFRSTVRDCLLDGFRPCLRCRPLEVGKNPQWLAGLLDRVEKAPSQRLTDGDLRDMGVSPHRARRYFTENFGMTFQAFHRARRMGMALTQLRGGGDALAVGLDHGYDSSSGFREAFEKTFGATPGKSNGVRCITTTCIETPVGPLVAAAVEEGVCMVEFADRRALQKQIASLKGRIGGAIVPGAGRHLEQLASELGEYFGRKRTSFSVRTFAPGTEFQQQVWAELCEIPYGQTWSYEQLARQVGVPGAARAVGRANGDNRIAIVIPCHRVVKADGSLGGYGGGKWRKQILLDLESGQRSFS